MPQSKRMKQSLELVDREQAYGLRAAVEVLKNAPVTKFDESVDLAVNLGVDPKHADQMVRGGIVLPHGTGKTMRILVFAKGDKEKEAQAAGADHVGADDLAKRIQEGWLDFDRVIATPDMMGVVGRLGRVLGPRGLMPNPKLGTVTMDVASRRRRAEVREGRIPRREGRHRPRVGRQEVVQRGSARRQRDGADRRPGARQARFGQGHLSQEDLDLDHDGSGPAHRPVLGRGHEGRVSRGALRC